MIPSIGLLAATIGNYLNPLAQNWLQGNQGRFQGNQGGFQGNQGGFQGDQGWLQGNSPLPYVPPNRTHQPRVFGGYNPAAQNMVSMVAPTTSVYINPRTRERMVFQGPSGFASVMDQAMGQMAALQNANADRVSANRQAYFAHVLPELIRSQRAVRIAEILGGGGGGGGRRFRFRSNTGARIN